jgi:transglutaminase-like putative cysteine protease
MTQVDVTSELLYRVTAPTSFIFNIAPAITDCQAIKDEKLTISPQIEFSWCALNGYGSRGIRLNVQPCDLKIAYSAEVSLFAEMAPPKILDEVDHPELPVEVLPFLNPSRYCESDRLGQFAWREFSGVPSGHSRVQSVADWVNKNISYISGSTDVSSSACDVLIQRTGVCRDFAHVSITLCRALGIPARYVSGYAVGLQPPDFHGFFEAYLHDRWYLFDATKMAPVSGLVRIGVGRDAADSSFATIVGQAQLQSMSVGAVSNQSVAQNQVGEGANAISTA